MIHIFNQIHFCRTFVVSRKGVPVMNLTISLKQLTTVIVDIPQSLFSKYEAGIRQHFTDYMRQHYASSIHGDQVNLETLGIGLQTLHETYMKKEAQDYSAGDFTKFAFDDHPYFTAQWMSSPQVSRQFSDSLEQPEIIEQVYIKRSVSTGRLIPCVNRKVAQSLLSAENTSERLEQQLMEIQKLLAKNAPHMIPAGEFEQYEMINMIAEKTASMILKKIDLKHAV